MIDHYNALVEIQGLDTRIASHLKIIEQETARLSFIKTQKNQKIDSLALSKNEFKKLSEELGRLEAQLAHKTSQLEKVNNHFTSLHDEKQLSLYEKEKAQVLLEKNQLEDTILEKYEQYDQLDTDIKETESFLTGVEQSIKEVQDEIALIQQKEEKEIKNYEERIDSLMHDIPSELLSLFQKTREKYRFKGLLTRVENNKCSRCRYTLDNQTALAIDKMTSVELCPSCQRLFIPYNSQ